MPGVIQTVLGPVKPEQVGVTLTHEHMYVDYRNFYIEAEGNLKAHFKGEISLKNVGFVQRYPYSCKSNVSFFTDDVKEAVLEDLMIFRGFGGSALVENTSHGLGRNVAFLVEASKRTGVHVVSGTGFYLANVQTDSMLGEGMERISSIIRTDLTSGCAELPEVKCGVIGEVASNYPIHDFEKKVIQATAMVQEELQCPVTFHPGRDAEAPFEIMRLYTEAGGNPGKAVMSHLDRTLLTPDLLNFAQEYKCFLQQDLFGTEVLTYQLGPNFQMPSDAQRLDRIKLLIEEGHLERILMSHDIHTKHRLISFGGHGYCHILANVRPKMKFLGIPDEAVDQITINNPRIWLSWNPPSQKLLP